MSTENLKMKALITEKAQTICYNNGLGKNKLFLINKVIVMDFVHKIVFSSNHKNFSHSCAKKLICDFS